ncbi:MAG: hypothetical protein JF610_12250 [Acidobacteria bacterium]|nr:hypothetical protein [Acidobacteriota bacterium]
MPELVQQHDDEIVFEAVVIVEPEVEVEVAAELRDDFRRRRGQAERRQQVDAGALVSERDVVGC